MMLCGVPRATRLGLSAGFLAAAPSACTIGERRVEAREIGDDLRWQVFAILESCAEKTREVEALIWRVDPDTADIYLGRPEHR